MPNIAEGFEINYKYENKDKTSKYEYGIIPIHGNTVFRFHVPK